MARKLEEEFSEEELSYPSSDGRPLWETDWHYDAQTTLWNGLKDYYADNPHVYVSGCLMMFYQEGDRKTYVSPDVFVVKGVANKMRRNYLTWREGKGPDMVIEVTSKATRNEDLKEKVRLYRDQLRVPEFFLFDPLSDYLVPPLQGFRLRMGDYEPIKPVRGRLQSKVLGLHMEAAGHLLRLYDPAKGSWLLTHDEKLQQIQKIRLKTQQLQEETRMIQAETESLRRETRELRRRSKRGQVGE